MIEQNHHIYEFGPFRLDASRRLLLRDGEAVKLFPKEFETLLALVERSGDELDKDELMRRVWGDTVVEESNLAKNISHLRKVLGESPSQHQYIVTVPGHGYCFVAGVRAAAFDEVMVHERTRAEVTLEEDRNLGVQAPNVSHVAYSDNAIAASAVSPVTSHVAVSNSQSPGGAFRTKMAAVFVSVILLTFGAILLSQRWNRNRDSFVPPQRFQQTEIKRLEINGDPRSAALSPDGKVFAYVLNDSDLRRSLWLGHVDGGEPKQLRPPAEIFYPNLTFSPDGSSIYFTATENISSRGALYKLPVFGGVAEKVKENVRNRIAFSPDGRQFAFVRAGANRTSVLVIADTSGGGEREIASRPATLGFALQSPSWSPDGSTIAIGAINDEDRHETEIFLVSIADGSLKKLTASAWKEIRMTGWWADASGLIAVASDKREGWDAQLWHVSYPDGQARPIATDLNTYSYATNLAADGKSLLALRGQHQSNIWLASADNFEDAKQITFDLLGKMNGWLGLAWTPDGRIVFTATADQSQTIWIASMDGSNKRQLLPSGHMNMNPTVTDDGRFVVFESDRTGSAEIWRAKINGDDEGDLKQLTTGGKNSQPHVSPDNRWVVYKSTREGSRALWRISIDGGEPTRLTDKEADWPRVSPDGKLIACVYGRKLAIIPFEGGQPIKLFELPRLANFNNGMRWTPEGRAVTYRDWADGIWRQPVDGGAPQRLAGLPHEKLYSYAWSRDGRYFAFTRGSELRDLVLIRDVR